MKFIRRLVGHYVDPLRLCAAYRIRGGLVVCGPDITIREADNYPRAVEVVKSDPFKFYSLDRKNIATLRDIEEVAYCTSYEDYMRRVQADRRAS